MLVAVLVATRGQAQFAVGMTQEDEAALGMGQAQRRFQQGVQDVVEHAAGIQLARCLEKDVEHLQVGARAGGRLPGGELAQELLGGAGGRAVGAEQDVRPALHAEFDVIVAGQLATVDPFAVDEGPVAAALVDDVDAVGFVMNCACSRETRGSAMTRSRSVRRPMVKGK